MSLFGCFETMGQEPILTGDTATVVDSTFHSPSRAALYSAIVPGLGQIYNRKYYKTPIIYAGFAGLGYFTWYFNDKYQLYRNDYVKYLGQDSLTILKYENLGGADLVKRRRDFFRRNRDLTVILAVGFYALNIIDAYVDAHLLNFDVGEDLTLEVKPAMQYVADRNTIGLRCVLKF